MTTTTLRRPSVSRITRSNGKLVLVNKDRAFTIIELLVVMAIIGLLAAIAIPVFSKLKGNAYDSATQSDLRQVALQTESAYANTGTYPASVRDNYYGGTTLDATALANVKLTNPDTEKIHYGRAADGSGFAVSMVDTRTGNAYCYDGIAGGMTPMTGNFLAGGADACTQGRREQLQLIQSPPSTSRLRPGSLRGNLAGPISTRRCLTSTAATENARRARGYWLRTYRAST